MRKYRGYFERRARQVVLIAALLSWLGRLQFSSANLTGLVNKLDKLCDPESLLAMGRPIPLSSSEVGDLLLIPGLGDTLAMRISSQKAEILAVASTLEERDAYTALEVVHGLGPKQSKKLSQYLDVKK